MNTHLTYRQVILILQGYIVAICKVALVCVVSADSLSSQAFSDGPYIFTAGEEMIVKYIHDGAAYEVEVSDAQKTVFEVEGLPKVTYDLIRPAVRRPSSYVGVDKIFALSDLHGQYDLMFNLLEANNVITSDGKWSFGDGHLVITGDNFDRGDKVMEILWFFYRLEQEAEEAGGRVHVLLGNHEAMVLNNDLRYLHPSVTGYHIIMSCYPSMDCSLLMAVSH